jgi:hypothetical protein
MASASMTSPTATSMSTGGKARKKKEDEEK